MKTSASLDFLFHPQSIAIAGVSENVNKFNFGLRYLQGLQEFGYPGKLYPLNPAGGEVNGMTLYKSLREIPGEVDYIISAIPAPFTPQLVDEAAAKGVKAIHFFTSGFSEIENAEGKRLQAEVLARAKKGGIRVIGPNCLGLYCPAGGLSFNGDYARTAGQVAMISQSGGNAAHCIQEGAARGVYFSYTGKAPFSRLIYPIPEPGGLGVHLTLDLGGQAKFGPDVEWIDAPDYHVDPARAERFYTAIRRWWPALENGRLQPGYAGVRPKSGGPGQADADFRIDGPDRHGVPGLIHLYGIESPGLTAALAIGDHVAAMAQG